MSELSISELSKELRGAIESLETKGNLDEVGVVLRVGDGVAWIHGLRSAGYSEVIEIETKDGTGQVVAIDVIAGTIKVLFEKGRAPLTYGVEEVQLNGKA